MGNLRLTGQWTGKQGDVRGWSSHASQQGVGQPGCGNLSGDYILPRRQVILGSDCGLKVLTKAHVLQAWSSGSGAIENNVTLGGGA